MGVAAEVAALGAAAAPGRHCRSSRLYAPREPCERRQSAREGKKEFSTTDISRLNETRHSSQRIDVWGTPEVQLGTPRAGPRSPGLCEAQTPPYDATAAAAAMVARATSQQLAAWLAAATELPGAKPLPLGPLVRFQGLWGTSPSSAAGSDPLGPIGPSRLPWLPPAAARPHTSGSAGPWQEAGAAKPLLEPARPSTVPTQSMRPTSLRGLAPLTAFGGPASAAASRPTTAPWEAETGRAHVGSSLTAGFPAAPCSGGGSASQTSVPPVASPVAVLAAERRPQDVLLAEERAAISEAIFSRHDPVLHTVCRGNMASVLAVRAGCAAEAARERRRRHLEVGEAHRKLAAEWRSKQDRPRRSRALPEGGVAVSTAAAGALGAVGQVDGGSGGEASQAEGLDRQDVAKQARNKFLGFGSRRGTAGLAQYKETLRNAMKDETQQGSQKVKICVAMRLKMRRQHTKKLVQLRRQRQKSAESLPEQELKEQRGAFDIYADAEGNLQPQDLLHCLMELGLSGRTRHEKWSVDKLCTKLYIALLDEHSLQVTTMQVRRPGVSSAGDGEAVLFLGEEEEPKDVAKTFHSVTQRSASPSSASDVSPRSARALRNRATIVVHVDSDGPVMAQALNAVAEQQLADGTQRGSFLQRIIAGGTRNDVTLPITFEDFSQEIVPPVRKLLDTIRQEVHFEEFLRRLGRGKEASVLLSPADFLAHVELQGLDMDDAKAALADLQQELEEKAMEAEGEGGKPRSQIHLPASVEELHLDHDTVHELLLRLEERTERSKHRLEHKIKDKVGLDNEVFWQYRHELVNLHSRFNHYDGDEDQCLTQTEAKLLLKHLGFQPFRQGAQAEHVQRLLEEFDEDGNGLVDFLEFLGLMERIRAMQRGDRQHRLAYQFRLRDRLGHGRIDVKEVRDVLKAIGMHVRPEDQDLVEQTVEHFDTDCAGEIIFEELEELVQRISERLQSVAAEQILRFADKLGISMDVFAEYQWAYDQLDTDGSGSLSYHEMKKALEMQMGRAPTKMDVEELYQDIKKDKTADIQITDFMQMMNAASSVRRLFTKEKPFTLRDVPAAKLRECLRCFRLAEGFISKISYEDLVEHAANYLEVKPTMDLREDLPERITSVRQLLAHAQKKAEETTDRTRSGRTEQTTSLSSLPPMSGGAGRVGGCSVPVLRAGQPLLAK